MPFSSWRKVLREGSGRLELIREAKLICRARVDGWSHQAGVTEPRPNRGNGGGDESADEREGGALMPSLVGAANSK